MRDCRTCLRIFFCPINCCFVRPVPSHRRKNNNCVAGGCEPVIRSRRQHERRRRCVFFHPPFFVLTFLVVVFVLFFCTLPKFWASPLFGSPMLRKSLLRGFQTNNQPIITSDLTLLTPIFVFLTNIHLILHVYSFFLFFFFFASLFVLITTKPRQRVNLPGRRHLFPAVYLRSQTKESAFFVVAGEECCVG